MRPATPPEGVPRREEPGEQTIGLPLKGPVGAAAQQAGIVMKRAPITPYTRPAMELGEYAKEQGAFDAYHSLTLKAYWEHGQNLGDYPVLQGLAEQAGMDPAAALVAVKERQYAQVVEDQVQFARSVGISGIPAYIIDRYLVVGAQPYDLFKEVAERVLQERETPAASEGEG